MRGWQAVRHCASLLAFTVLLPSCSHTVRNTEVCTVAGILAAGMDCANTLNDNDRSMDLDETIKFLEPYVGDIDDESDDRAGAMCMSADHFNQQKTDIEILCQKLGNACTYEIKDMIQKAADRVESLQLKTIRKGKPNAPKVPRSQRANHVPI